jgi:hypothetical protein
MSWLVYIVECSTVPFLTFGPLFMTMVGRGDTDRRSPLTRRINYLGLAMLMIALLWIHGTLISQRGEISVLEQRVKSLEGSRHAPGAP